MNIAPDRYKLGVIKTFLHRAYTICNSWELFNNETNRIKQLFTNNNFPMNIIDEEINKFMSKKIDNAHTTTEENNKFVLYYRNQMSSNYKQEEKILNKIVTDHVKPTDDFAM